VIILQVDFYGVFAIECEGESQLAGNDDTAGPGATPLQRLKSETWQVHVVSPDCEVERIEHAADVRRPH
jgi:hypothetical protein